MIGRKKLSAIREELGRALSSDGDDPIRWLEERISAARSPRVEGTGESPVLESLRRVLEPSRKRKRRAPRVGAKK